MTELPLLLTRNVHFKFNGKNFVQIDRVATGIITCSILVDILMMELERAVVQKLAIYLKFLRRCFDRMFC